MDTHIIIFPTEIDEKVLKQRLCLKENSPNLKPVLELLTEAKEIAKPRAIYKESYIESKGKDFVIIDGIEFKSRILRVNVDKIHRVFPYVVTCGHELDEWSNAMSGDYSFTTYAVDTIKEMIVESAHLAFNKHLDDKYLLESASCMNPGSLPDWPITEQKKLFKLLGNVKEAIGVELTESCLLIPVKSESGIRFPSEGTFQNCKLCPREKCPDRKVPYDPELINKYK